MPAQAIIATHLPPCPGCGKAPGKMSADGFWMIFCINEECPDDYNARHLFSWYAERRWRRHVGEHWVAGVKAEVDADYFPV